MACLYVPGLKGWASGFRSPSAAHTEPWVTSSGKPRQRPLSWVGWKTRPWIKILYSTICEPSLAISTAARWISSLPDSLASRGASPEISKASRTSAGSGHLSPTSFAEWSPHMSSWRTFQGSLLEAGSTPFSGPWPNSGSMRNGRLYERPTLERHSNGAGSSSWPTPDAGISTQVNRSDSAGAASRPTLGKLSELWYTPDVPNGGRKAGPDKTTKIQVGLENQAKFWPTPQAADASSGRQRASETTTRGNPTLLGAARSHPDQETEKPGQPSSETTPSSPLRLNPAFVEWLMGFPPGWSIPGETGFGRSAMRSYLCKQRRLLWDWLDG